MADIAALSLAETIISLVEFSWKVYKRVDEYGKSLGEVPEALEDVSKQLPLIVSALGRLKGDSGTADFSAEVEKAVSPVIAGCFQQVKKLESMLDTLLPEPGERISKKLTKAFLGVKNEQKLKEIKSKVLDYVHILTFSTVVGRGSESKNPRKILFDVPFERDEDFVGRVAELEELDKAFAHKARASLMGIGGIGKSQIAIEYCYRHHDKHPSAFIFWVYCSNVSRFRQSYIDIARKLDLPGWNDPSQNPLKLVVDWLNSEDSPDWLMIMDNVDNIELFFPQNDREQDGNEQESMLPYVPQSKAGRLLFTCRDQRVRFRFHVKSATTVEEPDLNEAARLLTNKLDSEEPNEAHFELVKHLDCLPLAITQAGSFMNETGTSADEYLQLLKAEDGSGISLLEEDVGDERRDATDVRHSNSVVGTWKITYNLLVARHPRAAALMSFMAMLDRHTIAKLLLEKQVESKQELINTIAVLQAFGFIKPNQAKTAFGMHRLAQLCTRRWLEQDGSVAMWEMKALCTVSKCFPEGVYENWGACEPMVPHAMATLNYLSQVESSMPAAVLLANLGLLDYSQGRYHVAEARLLHAIELYQTNKCLEEELITKRQLATVVFELREFDRAEKLCAEAIDGQVQLLGNDKPITLMSKVLLAKIYVGQRALLKAESIMLEVIDTETEKFGSKNLFTLYSKETLSSVYTEQGRYTEAETILVPLVEDLKEAIGDDHPDTILAMNGLMVTLMRQRHWEDARKKALEILDARKRTLGERHPIIRETLADLADIYYYMGRHKESIAIHMELLKDMRLTVGEDHPESLGIMHKLAILYRQQGQLHEAKAMGELLLFQRRKLLGEWHPDTLYTASNLAVVYQKLGLLRDAELMEKEMVEKGRVTFGESNMNVLVSTGHLATIYRDQGRLEDAELTGEKSVQVRKKFLGTKHPFTLVGIRELANTYRMLSRLEDAQKLEAYGVIATDQSSWPCNDAARYQHSLVV